jgi:hypothetical protein
MSGFTIVAGVGRVSSQARRVVRQFCRPTVFLLAPVVLRVLAFFGMSARAAVGGQITGTITDGTDAVIPDAQIAVTNTATEIAQHAESDGKGLLSRNWLTAGLVLSGITRFASGQTVTMTEVDDHSLKGTGGGDVGNGADEPNYTWVICMSAPTRVHASAIPPVLLTSTLACLVRSR